MSHIEAIYRHGVFEPLEPVDFREEQRVRLSIEPANKPSLKEWIEEVRAMQAEFLRQRGKPLADSTPDIAADRMR